MGRTGGCCVGDGIVLAASSEEQGATSLTSVPHVV